MPLQINVGLNRKASKNYQSTGVSINIQTELDATLLARPEELQRQVADLYVQAEAALDRQIGQPVGVVRAPAARATPAASPVRTTPRQDHQSPTAGRVGTTQPQATQAQIALIQQIARNLGINAVMEAQALGFDHRTLSKSEASQLITHLQRIHRPRDAA